MALPPWQPASSGIKPQSEVVLVAMAPDDPQILYLVTYEPAGLYCSTDGGMSWEGCNEGLEGVTVLSLAHIPGNSQTLYAGTVYGGYRSNDGGKIWEQMPTLPTTYVYALATAPEEEAIYAGTEGQGVNISPDRSVSWSGIGPKNQPASPSILIQHGSASSLPKCIWCANITLDVYGRWLPGAIHRAQGQTRVVGQ